MIEKDAVVRALTPLIGEYETLTMERIAQAAGLSEAELLTVFPDKEAVFETWVTMATAHLSATMDPTEEVRRLRAIPVDQPLASRLLQAIGILGTYHERVRADLASFPRGGTPGTSWDGPIGSQAETKEAVARLLRPDSQHLCLPADDLAEIFLNVSQVCTRVRPLPAEPVVDFFLRGALRP